MVHFIFGRRGIKASCNQQDIDLQAQRFLWKRTNLETGKVEYAWVQGALRPYELFEYVFPATSPILEAQPDGSIKEVGEIDNVKSVLASLDVMDKDHMQDHGYFFKKLLSKFKETLGLKDIPSSDINQKNRHIHLVGTSIYPIGIKEDDVKAYDFKAAGKYHQEGL